jgi:hypothetical protein
MMIEEIGAPTRPGRPMKTVRGRAFRELLAHEAMEPPSTSDHWPKWSDLNYRLWVAAGKPDRQGLTEREKAVVDGFRGRS